MTITELTPEHVQQRACEAAEQHIPLEEANDYEPGTAQWTLFRVAYVAASLAADEVQ